MLLKSSAQPQIVCNEAEWDHLEIKFLPKLWLSSQAITEYVGAPLIKRIWYLLM